MQQQERPKNGAGHSPMPVPVPPVRPPAPKPAVEMNAPKKPGAGRSRADAEVRYQYAVAFLRANPKALRGEVYDAVAKEYGVGLDGNHISLFRRETGTELKRHSHKSRIVDEMEAKRSKRQTSAVETAPLMLIPQAAASQVTVERSVVQGDSQAAVRVAVQLLLESVPMLRYLEVRVENGKPKVRFKEEVKTVTDQEIEL